MLSAAEEVAHHRLQGWIRGTLCAPGEAEPPALEAACAPSICCAGRFCRCCFLVEDRVTLFRESLPHAPLCSFFTEELGEEELLFDRALTEATDRPDEEETSEREEEEGDHPSEMGKEGLPELKDRPLTLPLGRRRLLRLYIL